VYNEFNDDDEANDLEHKNGRATLRWTPSDRWDISLIANVMDTDDHNGETRWIDGPMETHPFEIRQDSDGYSDQDGNVQTLRVKYSGDSFNVLSVSSLLNYRHYFQYDKDKWDNPMGKMETLAEYEDRQYSQELRVSSPQNSTPFEWLVGFYTFKEDTDTDFSIYMPMPGMSIFHPVADIETTSWAVFADGTYTLFERLHLTAGLRFDYQDLEGDLKDDVLGVTYDKDQDFDEWLPKFSVAYDLTDDVMVYASASKGYMVGGYNPYCSMNPTEKTFTYDEEKTWNYEAGIKTSWFNNKLMANLSIFYIDIKDKQVSEIINDIASITNAADAHSQGCELEIRARPIRGLDIFAGLGYTEAEFDDFKATEWNATHTALVENDYEDNDLQYAPNYTFSLGVQYRHESGFFGRADFLGTDNFYGDHANTAEADSYETVNLRLGYESEHFDFILWGKNVFDEEYLTFVHSYYGGYNTGVDGPPQTFGATITYRF
jgi:iron complex outermembrane receptor protein